jgi:hypothetical protein
LNDGGLRCLLRTIFRSPPGPCNDITI